VKATIIPGYIYGSLTAPPCKSHTQRAYAAALLHVGQTIIRNAGHSGDERAALQVIQHLGARVSVKDVLEITSTGVNPISNAINCGESGLAARLFTPIAAICGEQLLIEGTGSLLRRPMEGFSEILPSLNVAMEGFNGYLPFKVRGPMQARPISIDAGNGSQFLSGLLFALSAVTKEPLTLEVTNLKSKPYIDLTLEVLAHFGKPVSHKNYRQFYIDPALFVHKETIEISIEADWSSAAYFLVAGAIAGNMAIKNLQTGSKQADKAILEALRMAGAEITTDNNCISVQKSRLQPFDFNATDAPDLFPVLSILAACCGGESSIAGVHRLFYKESNRVESITEMLQDFAVPFSVEDDTLFVTGMPHLQGTIIDAYSDHRIVMAASVGALRANGPVEIPGVEAVNKSYPGFFDDFISHGGRYTLNI